MIDISKLYYDCAVCPLENKCKELKSKIYSHTFLTFLFKSKYIKSLNFYENLLFENYIKLGTILTEEYNESKN